MRNNKIARKILFLIVLAGTFQAGIAQVSFLEVTTEEEMDSIYEQATLNALPLFVDVYATWCGPCKMMDREVYTDSTLSAYMNQNFISVRMDGEKEFGRKFAAENRLEGYPTMFVFDSEGNFMSKVVGYTPADQLMTTLQTTLDNYATVNEYRDEYEAGTLNPEKYPLFLTALKQMGNDEEATEVARGYMDQLEGKKLSDKDMKVIGSYLTLDSKWWGPFSKDPDRMLEVLGDDYMLTIESIYNRSLVKGIDEDNPELIAAMAREIPVLVTKGGGNPTGLETLPYLQYYYYGGEPEELIAYVDDRWKIEKKDDDEWLYATASRIVDMDQQYRTPELLEKAAEWFQMCIDLQEKFDYYFYQGMVLYMLQKPDEARKSFIKAETLVETDDQRQLIEQVKGFINSR